MSELMTPLALLAYGTAAVVGLQLVAASVSRLADLIVRRNGRPFRLGQDPPPPVTMGDMALLLVGLFLLLQGVVVILWTFG